MPYHRHDERFPRTGLVDTASPAPPVPLRRQQLRYAIDTYHMQPLLRWSYRIYLWFGCGSYRGV